jgi:hypothetical protein
MTTKKRVVAEPVLAEPPPPSFDEWDGSQTALAVSHVGVVRDHRPVGPGSPCVGYSEPGTFLHEPCTLGPDGGPSSRHQFHVDAQLLPDGRWVGREAQHVRDLISGGWIAGTPESADRDIRQGKVDYVRGVDPDPERTDRPEGLPELKAPTFEQWLDRPLGKELAAGPQAMIAKEDGQRASDVRDLARAAVAQTGALTEFVEELRAARLAGAGAGEED